MNEKEQKAQRDLNAELQRIKSDKELLNALKADSEISANLSELKNEYQIQINRYNDIHFKKAMLQSLKHFADLEQCRNLRMRFEKNQIIIERAEKY